MLEASKVTTGSSSSLILISSDVLVPKATAGVSGSANETSMFSIGSSLSSCSPVKVTVALCCPAGIVTVSAETLKSDVPSSASPFVAVPESENTKFTVDGNSELETGPYSII